MSLQYLDSYLAGDYPGGPNSGFGNYDAWKLDCPPDDVCEGCEQITDLCECSYCETCDEWLPALDDTPHVCLCGGCGSESEYCECECEICGDALGITYIPDRMPRCDDHTGGE